MSRPGLFLRVYALSVGLSALGFAGVIAVIQEVLAPAQQAEAYEAMTWAGQQLLRLRGDPAALAQAGESLRRDVDLGLTIYGPDGARLVSNVEPPLPRPDPAILSRLEGTPGTDDGERWIVDLGGGAIGVAEDLDPTELAIAPWMLGAALAVLAGLAWPVAASISRPLRRLGGVVDRFGEGELGVRSGQRGSSEIAQLAMRFDQMADRIVALLGEERMWLAGMSHEFRTPLQRLRLALENAEDEEGRLSAAELAALSADVSELDELVRDVLATARFLSRPAGAHARGRERVDVAALLATACARAGVRAPEGLPGGVTVLGDRRLLSRALLNLLRNAQEHGGNAGVRVSMAVEGGCVTVRVADDGPGVVSEHRDAVWAPFARGALPVADGRGLGLALVRQIAESHGGRTTVEPAERGACFALTLPVAP